MADTEKKVEIEKKIVKIEAAMVDPSFWQNKAEAQETVARYHELKQELEGVGKYDKGEAIVTIFSGAGGDDAEDFSRMLYDMYQKFCTKKGFSTKLLHENQNNHGGYRNVTFEVALLLCQGYAGHKTLSIGPYGILKNESGVHRLVRVSPFNANGLRHTSFSLVEVIPKLVKTEMVSIPDDELSIEFARAGGPGGQNVNKRESAVRIVHVPTNLSAHSSSERSQFANREKALEILTGKLYKLREDERKKKEAGLYVSKTTEIEWGNQIRSYVVHPYKMVKDHRTDVEVRDVDGVFAGKLDEFIKAEKNL
ncbi:MAG TPA: peptide chain release factor-like protein [Candidatus Paceibacterota bacterium]